LKNDAPVQSYGMKRIYAMVHTCLTFDHQTLIEIFSADFDFIFLTRL
jgi:hypothetical protein